MPPPPPQTLPYPATQQNRGKLEAFLLDYYKSSTFNVCDHQTFPMMTGPPLRIMIDPNATPFAVHKPIPIPIHWQEDIYEGLKQDETKSNRSSASWDTCHMVPQNGGGSKEIR